MTIQHKDANKLVPLVLCNFLLNKASFSWLYGEKCFKELLLKCISYIKWQPGIQLKRLLILKVNAIKGLGNKT